jgi:hypothetical protein
MASVPIPITIVRHMKQTADPQLHGFVFGGYYAGRRPPRGIDPEYLSRWVRQSIKAASSPDSFAKVVELIRFYERSDFLDHFGAMLQRSERDDRSFGRSAYILQMLGEIGNGDQMRFAANYYNEYLVPNPESIAQLSLMLETAEALGALIDLEPLNVGLQAAIVSAAKVSDLAGPAGIRYRSLTDQQRLKLPRTVMVVQAKRRLLMADPVQRIPELIKIYLGESDLSGTSLDVWSARLVRAYVRQEDANRDLVYNAFSQIIDGTIRSKLPKPRAEFLIHRSAQALIYLGGKLTEPQEAAYQKIRSGPENFLWDDLTEHHLAEPAEEE